MYLIQLTRNAEMILWKLFYYSNISVIQVRNFGQSLCWGFLQFSLIILLMSLLDKKTRIWREGETTNPFVCPELSFSKEKRFKLYSIYWPEKSEQKGFVQISKSPADQQASRISKMIDEEQKNESRMNKSSLKSTKREPTFSETSYPKNGFSSFKPASTMSLSKQNQKIVERLAKTTEMKQSKLRDRHGHRTNIFENQQESLPLAVLREQRKFQGNQTGFYTSRRIKLDLPHNYYPGPGNYEIKRYLQQLQRKGKRSHQKLTRQ